MTVAQHSSTPSVGAEHILQVAIKLFAERGYEATSTREIVEVAGVTKPMLYYYFGSKEGLCKAALSRFAEGFFDFLQRVIEIPMPPREALVEFVWAHFQHFREHADVTRLYFGLYFGPQRPVFAEHIEQLGRRGHELGRELVGRIATSGILRPGCQEDFFMALQGLIKVWNMTSLIEGVELTRDLAERVVDGLLHGYATREA